MSKDNGGSAFPTDYMAECPDCENQMVGATAHSGMTLRDYFAGQALIKWHTERDWEYQTEHLTVKDVAETCFKIADAMIAERGK